MSRRKGVAAGLARSGGDSAGQMRSNCSGVTSTVCVTCNGTFVGRSCLYITADCTERVCNGVSHFRQNPDL